MENKDKEEAPTDEENSLVWLLRRDSTELTSAPMDTNIAVSSNSELFAKSEVCSGVFTRKSLFQAASHRDPSQLTGLLEYLRANEKQLSDPEFIDESNGKTVLMKALLNLKDDRNDTIKVFLDVAEKTGDLENLVNASYNDWCYKGQMPLHIAIERRSFEYVKLLVQKGADVQAKANGKFFQNNEYPGFYFGEIPLSLAACTNQPDVVSFLMDNPYKKADVTDKDSQGNTVLHALVVLADNTDDNTDMIARMYDGILIQHYKLEKKTKDHLEAIENNEGLTPLKLAAKLGKIGLFKHMLHREFPDKETKPLSRKFAEWVYGPVHSSLYDITSINTDEENSVLEIIVFGSEIPNRPKMLQIEPLRSLLKDKWDRFASKLFFINFLVYLVYLTIFTIVAIHRKEGKPPFPIEEVPLDYWRAVGEVICVLGAAWFFYKSVMIFKRNPPKFRHLYTDGFSDILFFVQATLLLICPILYFCQIKAYVGLLVLSLALAWINILYYARGNKQLGIYNVMVQRMILSDILDFLLVYSVFLFGFAAAIMALMKDPPPDQPSNATVAPEIVISDVAVICDKPSFTDIRFTVLELFKFAIGMGDLQFTDQVQYKEVYYILLVLYIVLTYILLLNMLIALMGFTVERMSSQSEDIWNLQRSLTILDLEGTMPKWFPGKLFSRKPSRIIRLQNTGRKFLRVEEINWSQWRSDLCEEEDPGNEEMLLQSQNQTNEKNFKLPLVMERILARRQPQQSDLP